MQNLKEEKLQIHYQIKIRDFSLELFKFEFKQKLHHNFKLCDYAKFITFTCEACSWQIALHFVRGKSIK